MRRRFNLKVHMRTHLGQHAHEFACKLCGESFVQRSNLKRHMLTNHEKPVKCPCCKARFVTKEAAHAHTVEVHPDAQKKKVRVRRIPEKKPTFAYVNDALFSAKGRTLSLIESTHMVMNIFCICVLWGGTHSFTKRSHPRGAPERAKEENVRTKAS